MPPEDDMKECPDCEGSGEDEDGEECRSCNGDGEVPVTVEDVEDKRAERADRLRDEEIDRQMGL
jgi:RecJ-like exonuclease